VCVCVSKKVRQGYTYLLVITPPILNLVCTESELQRGTAQKFISAFKVLIPCCVNVLSSNPSAIQRWLATRGKRECCINEMFCHCKEPVRTRILWANKIRVHRRTSRRATVGREPEKVIPLFPATLRFTGECQSSSPRPPGMYECFRNAFILYIYEIISTHVSLILGRNSDEIICRTMRETVS
jgi:hypothetical protein